MPDIDLGPAIGTGHEAATEMADRVNLRDWNSEVERIAEAAVRAAAPLIVKAAREQVAQTIEVATGLRCPSCHRSPSASRYSRALDIHECIGGHSWSVDHIKSHPSGFSMAAIARGGEADSRG